MDRMMRVNLPGLVIERQRSGALRYRVRPIGNTKKRVLLTVTPDNPAFLAHYTAARHGDPMPQATKAEPKTLQWLVDRYLAHLAQKAKAGLGSHHTLDQRKSLLRRFCAMVDPQGTPYGELHMLAPTTALVKARDKWMDRPAEADNLIKAIRAMYSWAEEAGEIHQNPAKGIRKIHKPGGGAKPWTADDLRKFTQHHPIGTTAYAWLALSIATGCRIDDARQLGRKHETEIDGQLWLAWQPGKRGSAPVEVPMMPLLVAAIRALKVQGATYLLTEYGRPFAYGGLGNRVRDWCNQAGLQGKSAHGVRKALAELLAEAGCSQHQIMAVLSHTQAKTSEVYTKGAQRRILAGQAMRALSGIKL